MYIKGYETNRVEVEISDDDVKKIAEQLIRQVGELPYDSQIKDGKLSYDVESHGGTHSWYDTTVIRKATKTDIILLDLIARINELSSINVRL